MCSTVHDTFSITIRSQPEGVMINREVAKRIRILNGGKRALEHQGLATHLTYT